MGTRFFAFFRSSFRSFAARGVRTSVFLFVAAALLFSAKLAGEAARADSGSPPKVAPPSSVHAGLLGAVDEITRKVATIRGLPPKAPFARGILTREQIVERLKDRIHQDYSPDEVRKESLVLKRMGLLPMDADYEKLLFDLLSEQVAGFYDPYRNMLYLADWLPLEMQRPALAHEIQHALQDQYFDLKKLAKPQKGQGDKQLAQSALIEGDGTSVMLEFAAKSMGVNAAQNPQALARLGRQMMQLSMSTTPSFQKAPAVLRETLMFPYAAGLEFVATIRGDGSWSKIDAAFLNPPISTEQVLHPEKYVAGEKPVQFATPPLALLAASSHKEQHRDVLGEWMWKVWFSRAMPEREAVTAAAGWGGDILVSFAQPGETLPIVVALSAWDNPEETDEAELAAQKLVLNLTGRTGEKLPGPGKTVLFERTQNDRVYAVARKDNRVLLLCGALPKTAAPLSQEILRTWLPKPSQP
ncbi:MAG TPA: hypothetical protein PKE31_18950 [Pseudomonadota bacterium]|nr:hypothetical protein [Pseudomonadota bacterium]